MNASSSTCRSRVLRCPLNFSRPLGCPWPLAPASAASSDFRAMASQSSSSNRRTATISTGLSFDPHRCLPQAVQGLCPASAAATLPPESSYRILVLLPVVLRAENQQDDRGSDFRPL